MRPAAASSFETKKVRILRQLQRPAGEYADASPKGSVDARIRPLIDDVNRADGFITTSSCAGRVSVFVDGLGSASCNDGDGRRSAGVRGKGSGGRWLLVSHDPVAARCFHGQSWFEALGYDGPAAGAYEAFPLPRERRMIHFKFEPMVRRQPSQRGFPGLRYRLTMRPLPSQILHVLTASSVHAQLVLRCALQAGFRESGTINLTDHAGPPTPMVAIRSSGLGFESLVGYECDDTPRRRWLVSADYLETLRIIANERFADNANRILRFQTAFIDAVALSRPTADLGGLTGGWEDAATRNARMRADGLRRQADLAEKKKGEAARSGE